MDNNSYDSGFSSSSSSGSSNFSDGLAQAAWDVLGGNEANDIYDNCWYGEE